MTKHEAEHTLFDMVDDAIEGLPQTAIQPSGWEADRDASSTLSDFEPECGGLPDDDGNEPTDSRWREMDGDAFLEMSAKAQLEYCMNRDEDSALFAASQSDRCFYLRRADKYRAAIRGLDS